jgi:hypothetical protein
LCADDLDAACVLVGVSRSQHMLHWCLADGDMPDELTKGGNMTPMLDDLCFAVRYATVCAETNTATVDEKV